MFDISNTKHEIKDLFSTIPKENHDIVKCAVLETTKEISPNHYSEIERIIEKHNNVNAVPEDFYYESDNHYFNVCKKYIASKNIVNIKAVEKSLKIVTDHIYNFSINHISEINERCLHYPTSYYTYILNESNNIESLLKAIKSAKELTDKYDFMFKLSIAEIQENEVYNLYLERKKLKVVDPSIRLGYTMRWDNKNKQYIQYNSKSIQILVQLLDKCGVYKLFDSDKELVYIGKSYNLGSRIVSSIRERNAYYFSYTVIDNKVDTDMYEIFYISKFKPVLNGTSKNEDYPTIELAELEFEEPIYIL